MHNFQLLKKNLTGCILACVIMLFSVVITSCGDDEVVSVIPEADFTFSASFLEVTFTDASTDAESYAWDFGDNQGTSTVASPTYTYADAGSYEVKLTVTSATGDVDELTTQVTVAAAVQPVSDFTFEVDGLQVTFTDASTDADSYQWDFGDDSGTSTDASPVYTYADEGTYEVQLTVTSTDGLSAVQTKSVMVAVPAVIPDADFSFVASDLMVTFTDASTNADSYAWDFGVEGTDADVSTDASPAYTYAEAGTYTVSLTVTSSTGDTDMTSQMVTVTAASTGATFAAALQNADFQTYPTSEQNNNDLVDAWTVDPDNNFNDGTESPFNFWRNDDLESWVSDPANNGGDGTTDKASSSGTDATSAGGKSDRSLKFDSSGERAYQPFEVEDGITYNISVFIKSEATEAGSLEGTFYILSDEPADDTSLSSVALATLPVNAVDINTWHQVSLDFTASDTFGFSQDRVDENAADILTSTNQKFVIFYFVPTTTVSGDNEIWITDVEISTPGF
ncbi:MAG: PKD domain-containing protein [Bacteroidota bacterium]